MFGRFRNSSQASGAPPRYSRIANRYKLRWPLIIASGLGLIWALAVGVDSLRDMGDDGETSYLKLFDVLTGVLYLVVAGIEAFVIFVAAIQNVKFAKLLRIAAPVGVLVAVAACVLEIVVHYTSKTDLINQCAADYVGGTSVNRQGDLGTITADQAVSLCDDAWSRGTWRVYAWLIIVALFAIFIAGMTVQYYRQLLNPPPVSSNQSIPLQPWSNNPPPPNNWGAGSGQQQQPWMVPPYPGPPPPGQEPFEKGDYQPAAEWAQAGYAPPPGPPPAGASRDLGEHRAEEEAWERARTEGVTAHLTGHGPNRNSRNSDGTGYVVGNTEEDEAWERARTEGVTAHLTGHQKPRRNHDEI